MAAKALALSLLAAGAAAAQPAATPSAGAPVFSIRNDGKALVRCLLMEGGPITQLVAIRPGHAHVERIAPGQAVSLACPALRQSFGPFAAGRYALRRAKGRTEVVRLP